MAKSSTVKVRNTYTSNAVVLNQGQTLAYLREVSRKASDAGIDFPAVSVFGQQVCTLDYIEYTAWNISTSDGVKAVLVPISVDFKHIESKPTEGDKKRLEELNSKCKKLIDMCKDGIIDETAFNMLWTKEEAIEQGTLAGKIESGGKAVAMTCDPIAVVDSYDELAQLVYKVYSAQ